MIGNPLSHQVAGDTGLAFMGRLIPTLIIIAFVAAVIIFFFMLIIGGVKWISSGGDKQALDEAKHQLTNALVGLFALFCVYAIFSLISTFFGNLQLFNFTINPLIQ